MMKKACLLFSVLAVVPLIRSESDLYLIGRLEQALLYAIDRQDLVLVRHQLKRFAHMNRSADEKKKSFNDLIFNDLIGTVDAKTQEIGQWTRNEIITSASFGIMGAWILNMAYHDYVSNIHNTGRSFTGEKIFGAIGALCMGGPIASLIFEKNKKVKTMQLIRQALEDPKKNTSATS